jgi:hypothetical protein
LQPTVSGVEYVPTGQQDDLHQRRRREDDHGGDEELAEVDAPEDHAPSTTSD